MCLGGTLICRELKMLGEMIIEKGEALDCWNSKKHLMELSLFRSSKRKSQTNHGRVNSMPIPGQLALVPDCPSCEGTAWSFNHQNWSSQSCKNGGVTRRKRYQCSKMTSWLCDAATKQLKYEHYFFWWTCGLETSTGEVGLLRKE